METPSDFQTRFHEANALQNSGHQEAAVKLLSELVSEHPGMAALQWSLGYAYLDSGEPEKSILQFMEAIRIDPKSLPAWGGLGQAYAELENWDLAEEAFRKRLGLRDDPNHNLFLAEVLNAKDDYTGALRCCERAIALRPDDSEGFLNLGLTLRHLKLFDEAAEAFEKATALDPDDPRATAELGFMKYGQGDLDAAERLLRRALVSDTSIPWHHLYLGLTLEAKQRYREAEREFRSAGRRGADDELILWQLKKFLRRQRKRRSGR
jgi:tetratricopeptide (TPR) repeat protein